VADPRRHLLKAVLAFVRAARSTSGVHRIALLGSLTTDKPVPKDADVLATIDAAMNLDPLARLGRRLKGTAQTINLGADIFLADEAGRYMGRICHYRECHPRAACRALSCGLRQHLNDDLQIVTLSPTLVTAPPVDLWPRVCRALCRADRYASDSGRKAGRRTSQDLSPRAARESDLGGDAKSRCSAEHWGRSGRDMLLSSLTVRDP
jgi:hypothetical protein